MSKVVTIMIMILLVGCASPPKYTFTASTPAYIEIGGVIRCKETPCTITPPIYVDGFGACVPHASASSIVEAFPIDKTKGYVQQKVINAQCDNDAAVYFDMEATAGVKTIQQSK